MSLTDVFLRDEFEIPVAAGAVNGTLATDGINTRAVMDTENKLSISSGKMQILSRTTPTMGDPSIRYNAIARSAGCVLVANLNYSSPGYSYCGFDTNTTGVLISGLGFDSVRLYAIKSNVVVSGSLTSANYQFAICVRAIGDFLLIRGGAYSQWTLVWVTEVGAETPIYPAFANRNDLLDSDYIRVAGYWLPIPIVSDGFNTNGTSDGLGHAETLGIGSGGSGVSWSNVGGGWSVSGGKVINTPNLGSEKITDGGFESWNSSTDLTNWIETVTGASAINREASIVNSGAYAMRMDIDVSGSLAYVEQNTLMANRWYRCEFWAKANIAGRQIAITGQLGGTGGQSTVTLTTTWTKYTITRFHTESWINIKRWSGNTSAYIDDFSVKQLTLSDLLSLHSSTTPDVFLGIDLTVTAGTQVGLALNWDSYSSPANGIIAYHDGANAKLEKCVAGTWTTVVSAAATYSANARIVVSKIGTAYRLYYNNALVGSGTISDSGIISNTLHGLFSTYEGNQLDNYTCYASGTGGEYGSAFVIQVSASGVSAGVGDSTANPTRKRTASGVSAGVGDSTANPTRKRTASGVSAGAGSANGTSAAKRLASGQSNGTSNANGTISVRRNVSGQSDGTGSASATSSRKRTVGGASSGRGTATIHNYTVSATISS